MKLNFKFVLVLFSLSGVNNETSLAQQNIYFNPDLIQNVWSDTIPNNVWLNNQVKEVVNAKENDKGIITNMFPFCIPDSVVAYGYNNKYRKIEKSDDLMLVFENSGISRDLELKNGTRLNSDCISKLTEFLNIPSNFGFENCGTPIPFGVIVFYEKKELKAIIAFSCDGLRQVECYSVNKRIKSGAILHKKMDW